MAESKKKTLQEFGRGIIGGLLFSLPLIYTMEVWWAGFIAPPVYQICFVLATFLLLLGYNTYAGMKKDSSFWEVCWDSVEEIGLAMIVSFVFLLLISQIDLEMSLDEISGKVILESMIVAIGISVGTSELGGDSKDTGKDGNKKGGNGFLKMLVLSVCGSVLFASSVAPTEEILLIAVGSEYSDLILLVLVTLLLCYIILFYSDFLGASDKRKVKPSLLTVLSKVSVAYIVALGVSFGFLWFFGRLQNTGLALAIAQIVILAVPGAIGASAGRFIIQGK